MVLLLISEPRSVLNSSWVIRQSRPQTGTFWVPGSVELELKFYSLVSPVKFPKLLMEDKQKADINGCEKDYMNSTAAQRPTFKSLMSVFFLF